MLLAIALASEAGVCVILVDSLSCQIGEPRFNVSGRDKDCYAFIRLTPFISRFDAGAFNLSYSSRNISPVGIDKHNQRLFDPVLSCSVIG
ncbi:MAG: hypothetical protein MUC88_10605 [Planctomycetes bacterium]|jgi:hypothetical protein|nr:hypothetical protein [Planctomycetota bacterium]